MSECTIRRMTREDLDAVIEIENITFKPPWSRDAFLQELNDNAAARYLVAEADSKVVGYAGTWIIFDESRVTNIAITPECRGRGWGRQLFDALIHYSANLGAEVMTLEVRVSNDPAIGLYKSMGFKKVHEIKKHYSDGENAWLMLLEKMPPVDPDFTEAETVFED